MPGPKPGPQPRPMGGFNSGMGAFNEHLDESAFKTASQQKQLTQQQTNTQPASGKSGTHPLLPQTDAKAPSGEGKGTFQPQKPREVGSFQDELMRRPLKDIKKGLVSIFDLKALLNINTQDTPQEQAKKQSLHQRFGKLTEEQQQVAGQKYQEAMQKKKREQEEEERKKQEKEAKQQSAVMVPSSPKKGPIGPASGMSKKQKTASMVQQSRQGLSQVGKKF
ncbi:hypothetical protein KJ707_04510 [Patescibacteria group bacterium]|nr:hypothetical protein [Patescibacteria group bacterium]MBU2543795.1 hypothetical protein [Patescibacteria group bacterium]